MTCFSSCTRKYSVYSLYWYKSTNTDAGAQEGEALRGLVDTDQAQLLHTSLKEALNREKVLRFFFKLLHACPPTTTYPSSYSGAHVLAHELEAQAIYVIMHTGPHTHTHTHTHNYVQTHTQTHTYIF
jgi:hypothetical protein